MSTTLTFPQTRAEALQAWRTFQPRITSYAQQRNRVHASHRHVSCLSPSIRHGLLQRDEIILDSLQIAPWSAIEKWVQEIVWRSYWKNWLELRSQVWRQWRKNLHQLRRTLPPETLARAAQIESGQSGVEIIDYFTHELIETGYLHNHARMWWASYWIHVARLPWELGAEFFFRHLLDADPASNTLSWRWVAGLHTVGKSYLIRRSNLEKYATELVEQYSGGLEQLDDDIVSSVVLPIEPQPEIQTPEPSDAIDTIRGKIGLWIHHDDLTPELSPLSSLTISSIFAYRALKIYQHYGLSEKRQNYLRNTMNDALLRAEQTFGCSSHYLETVNIIQTMVDWAKAEKLTTVVSLRPFVGPIGDLIQGLRNELTNHGISLKLVRRSDQEKEMNYAKSGYFNYWQKIQKTLKDVSTNS